MGSHRRLNLGRDAAAALVSTVDAASAAARDGEASEG